MQFEELKIIPSILKALNDENYKEPTPIQEKSIPSILTGKDLLACAQTGTGKTAAFAIPTLQLLCEEMGSHKTDQKSGVNQNIRALILTPTRELALQIYESFNAYGKYTNLRYCVIFGGVPQKPQEEQLKQGVDILVATPGRLNDLITQNIIDLKNIKLFILDEADRMLDMGFINDVNKIIDKTPIKKQTLLFSATMPPAIARMASTILSKPDKINISPVSSTANTIEQYVYFVDKENRKNLLLELLKDESIVSVLIFVRTKINADRLVHKLVKSEISAKAIHGDKGQNARQLALSDFKNKKLRVLVATDIAARGIDIDELSYVINLDMPDMPETYVHRIGRTGRAGQSGKAISFCSIDDKEMLADIEKLIGIRITEIKDHPFPMVITTPTEKKEPNRQGTVKKAPVEKKKLRMAADGTLKEKKSHSKINKFGKKDSSNSNNRRITTGKAGGGKQKSSSKSPKQR
ncbi:DEAD/DEAH box helicase [Anaeromicropila herbilytica]|uniref:ATP-dependent RNA helicase CshA n=1 Tax=Anaeromicropila herbilytica TaxID=2785025 RepID=A0A7R7ICQ9_9FIRM|nr:DEAD/DEAH box helicase [Anaeromicropila herbilytica]BCN29243.1 DEAD/DEAH box family ATP-dependent RNA helicase [Anaeromicropila herbilytica]